MAIAYAQYIICNNQEKNDSTNLLATSNSKNSTSTFYLPNRKYRRCKKKTKSIDFIRMARISRAKSVCQPI
jgi:hypothetical protein